MSRSVESAAIGLLLITVTGCNPDVTGVSKPTTQVTQYVTGNASRRLGSNRLFTLNPPEGSAIPEISQQQAELLAQAWAIDFAPGLRPILEKDHGSPINFSSLRACGRSLYATSAFDQSPANGPGFQRAIGSWWLVPICSGSSVTLSVAVSALATDLTLENGRIQFPPNAVGNDFFGVGVPQTWSGAVPVSPEDAVVEVGRATGRLIAEVPTLIAPSPFRGPPQAALWEITLDRPVKLHGSKTRTDRMLSKALYGAPSLLLNHGPAAIATPGLAIPLADQPAAQPFGSAARPGGQRLAHVKTGMPVRVEPATLTPGGN